MKTDNKGLNVTLTPCKTCNGRGKVQDGIAGEELIDCQDCVTSKKPKPRNWEKLAKERGEEIVAIKAQMQSLIQNWNIAARSQDTVGERHDDIYGTGNQTYLEHKERARSLRDCAEHLAATLEHFPDPVKLTGPELKDMVNIKSHGQKVEPAMLLVMGWLIRSRYRTLQHRHTGYYRATDESTDDEWQADSIVGLAEQMAGGTLQ